MLIAWSKHFDPYDKININMHYFLSIRLYCFVKRFDHSDCLCVKEFIQLIKSTVVVGCEQVLFVAEFEKIMQNKLPRSCGNRMR